MASMGEFITSQIRENTYEKTFNDGVFEFINTRNIIKALGFDIIVDDRMREAGVLTTVAAPSPSNPNPGRSTIRLSKTCSPSRQKCVAAWLLAGYLVNGNYSSPCKISVEVTEVARWRTYMHCTAMFLATRLVIPESIITAYCKLPHPGEETFNGNLYAERGVIETGFLQSCYTSNRVVGILDMLSSTLDLSLMSSSYMAKKTAG